MRLKAGIAFLKILEQALRAHVLLLLRRILQHAVHQPHAALHEGFFAQVHPLQRHRLLEIVAVEFKGRLCCLEALPQICVIHVLKNHCRNRQLKVNSPGGGRIRWMQLRLLVVVFQQHFIFRDLRILLPVLFANRRNAKLVTPNRLLWFLSPRAVVVVALGSAPPGAARIGNRRGHCCECTGQGLQGSSAALEVAVAEAGELLQIREVSFGGVHLAGLPEADRVDLDAVACMLAAQHLQHLEVLLRVGGLTVREEDDVSRQLRSVSADCGLDAANAHGVECLLLGHRPQTLHPGRRIEGPLAGEVQGGLLVEGQEGIPVFVVHR
mmetsp:Transcript_35518/g.114993  ORF Transcript_35518/g.114993 Transcript_35518/m.114993 type:complete len:324 (+) Transcript_35518:1795-2766(+)